MYMYFTYMHVPYLLHVAAVCSTKDLIIVYVLFGLQVLHLYHVSMCTTTNLIFPNSHNFYVYSVLKTISVHMCI